MSTLREAAATWVDAGRWLATVEIYTAQLRTIDAAKQEERATVALNLIEGCRKPLETYARAADDYRRRSDELMLELEHPGAVLARRVLRTLRAARAAWRDST